MEYKNLNSLSKLLACHQPMIVHLLLSISIFCLVFSHSSIFSSLMMYSKNLNNFYSSHTFHLLISGAANKNCIFLICNGLLFFVAKTSASVPNNSPSPSSFNLNDDVLQTATEFETQPLLEIKDVIVVEEMIKDVASMEESSGHGHVSITEEGHEEEMKENEGAEEFDEGTKEFSVFIAESADEEGGERSGQEERENGESGHESKSKDCWLFDDEEEDEVLYGKEEVDEEDEEEEYVYDDGTEKLSTEELNKKFEDFIRKTKEEIRINEARQHYLIMVS